MCVQMAEMLRPATDRLRLAALAYLASHLEEVVMADIDGIAWLPTRCLLDLLSHPSLVRPLCAVDSTLECCRFGAMLQCSC